MTLGEGKKKVYELLDEYSSGGELTEDKDIELKLADFFDIAQKRVAMVKRIVAVKTINRTAGKTEYSMPGNFGGLYRVWRDGKATGKYRWKGSKIVIPTRNSRWRRTLRRPCRFSWRRSICSRIWWWITRHT